MPNDLKSCLLRIGKKKRDAAVVDVVEMGKIHCLAVDEVRDTQVCRACK